MDSAAEQGTTVFVFMPVSREVFEWLETVEINRGNGGVDPAGFDWEKGGNL